MPTAISQQDRLQSLLQTLLNDCRDVVHGLEIGDPVQWGVDGFEAMTSSVLAVADTLGIQLEFIDLYDMDDEEED